MNGEKRQVPYRLDEEVAKQMEAAAAMYEVSGELGPFWRKLTLWAFAHYCRATCWSVLKNSTVIYPKLKRPR